MKKIQKKVLSVLLGLIIISSNITPTITYAGTEDLSGTEITSETPEEPPGEEEITLHEFFDYAGFGVPELILKYGEDFETAVPDFDGISNIKWDSFIFSDPSEVDNTKTTVLIKGWMGENPFNEVTSTEEIFLKPWDNTITEFNFQNLGYYWITYTFKNSEDGILLEQNAIVSVKDEVPPTLQYDTNEHGYLEPLNITVGSEMTDEEIAEHINLQIQDNRLGILSLDGVIDTSSIRDAENKFTIEGFYNISIPSEAWTTSFKTAHPYETGEIAPVNLLIHVQKENTAPEITGKDIKIKLGEAYENPIALHEIAATDFEDGIITNDVEIQSDYRSVLFLDGDNKTTKPGIYMVKFEITDSEGKTSELLSKVTVYKDVEIEGDDVYLSVESDYSYSMHNITGIDAFGNETTPYIYDSPIGEGPVKTTPGVYSIFFAVLDEDGIPFVKEFKIYITNDAPIIFAQGVILNVGEEYSYNLHSVSVMDNEEPTSNLAIRYETVLPEGLLQPSDIGTYPVRIYVKDSYGEESYVDVDVTVKPNDLLKPIIKAKPLEMYLGDTYQAKSHLISVTDKNGKDITNKAVVINFSVPNGVLEKKHVGTSNVEIQVVDDFGVTNTLTTKLTVFDTNVGIPPDAPEGPNPSVPPGPIIPIPPITEPNNPNPVNPEIPGGPLNPIEPGKMEKSPPTILGKDITLWTGDIYTRDMHQILAKDRNGAVLVFKITDTDMITGQNNEAIQEGLFYLMVTATDSEGLTTLKQFNIRVVDKDKQVVVDGEKGYYNDEGVFIPESSFIVDSQIEEIHQYGVNFDINTLFSIGLMLTVVGVVIFLGKREKVRM